MASTQIVWFRRDLRVRDHPALHAAASEGDRVIPLFVVDPAIVGGTAASRPRAAFLADCLADLDAALRERGGRLVVRHGDPVDVLPELAKETGADVVRWTSDPSPYARTRDDAVTKALEAADVAVRPAGGQYCADVSQARTKQGGWFTTFSPFWRAWEHLDRRSVLDAPSKVSVPQVGGEGLPSADDLCTRDGRPDITDPFQHPGEEAGLKAARAWLDGPIEHYADRHDAMTVKGSDRPSGGTSGLSPHLRWGTISPRWLEARARKLEGKGPAAYVRQLAWRDFYAHVYLDNPGDRHNEHQKKYRGMPWEHDDELLDAWKAGRTGFPLVDAGMRQLAATGWMHNRTRMVVGSFLTKDLHLDWRDGERHFHQLLLDGEPNQNDGNWQWIASVGVDPKPYFQRMFNPILQQKRFDTSGEYVRRWIPELANVPDKRLPEPWNMTDEEQAEAGCRIGDEGDYPAPIVDHFEEREVAATMYRSAGE